MASQLADALIFIRHHQDGEIAEKIRNSGLKYNMNYGVSSLLLANYAKTIGRNQALADQLWKENFREAKLLTFMIADPESASKELISNYILECENNEMVEIGVIHFFSKLKNAFEYATQWIQSENQYKKMAAYLIVTRLAMTKKFGDENDLLVLFPSFEKDILSEDFFVYQSVTKAFQEIAFRRPDLHPLIIEKTKYLCERNKSTKVELQLQNFLKSIQTL